MMNSGPALSVASKWSDTGPSTPMCRAHVAGGVAERQDSFTKTERASTHGLDCRMRSAADSRDLRWLALYLFGSFAAAGLGGLSTARAIPTWYRTLRKPGWNPPDAAFGPVWSVLYTFMAFAAWLVRRGMRRPQCAATGTVALRLWWLQLGLNLAWSLTFFGRRRPGWALVVISMLEVTIIATTVAAARVSRLAAALLTPYAVWAAFASALNFRIWQLNR
jgi:translocator protein